MSDNEKPKPADLESAKAWLIEHVGSYAYTEPQLVSLAIAFAKHRVAAEARGRAEERAKVVAMLREWVGDFSGWENEDIADGVDLARIRIERGDHDPAPRETSERTHGPFHYDGGGERACISKEPGAVCAACEGTGRYGFRDDDECQDCNGSGVTPPKAT